ncbi:MULTISPECIES: hypothetical protein [Microbacterium]|uniref:Uncharacterized protein n=1 Tax=Microbacterium trichothecenolyticum TaxID=69370 RepID=A0A0M2HH30_MICTR|nr:MULTISPECIES: hypothetical protein [Microbacterium]KJL44060.1 hypothetical protein RS82_01020 [Microbacterium trichothecenolyticum]MDR7189144.1 type II secretory pathway pseudopilin PulG [Microbacterium sp. BE35]
MAGFWGRRKREQEELNTQDADLARRAQQALVAADERIRLTTDELAFADAELGPGPTNELREALASVRTHLQEAFHLHQLNHDEIPDTPEELRTRNARIVQLCEWAEDLLDDRTEALAAPIERARRAPEIIAKVRADAARLRLRLPDARSTVDRLAIRYSSHALSQIEANPAEAEQLLGFAEHSAGVAERRREAGQREQANMALEASTESVRRAETLIDAVETFEVEALRAESTLAAIVEDSRGDLVVALKEPHSPAVQTAIEELQAALAALPAAGVNTDPFEQLSRLREANAGLDAAIAAARDRAARPIPPLEHVCHAIDDADRQLAVSRDVIAGHRGWIGADARTRFAEAERVRLDLDRYLGSSAAAVTAIDEDHREQAFAMARRAAFLASEALQLAQRDIDAARPQPDQWGGPGYGQQGYGQPGWGGGRRGGGSDVMGGILGGLVIGSILDGIFD